MKWKYSFGTKHSKRYVFISKHVDGSVIKIESRDVVFLEEDFSYQGWIEKWIRVDELEYLVNFSLNTLVYIEEEILRTLGNSESDMPNDGKMI